MATYRQIQDYVREHYGYVPKTCWIAHAKELAGIPTGPAPNRIGPVRGNPCPPGRAPDIIDAFVYFGMLNSDQKLLLEVKRAEQETKGTDSYPVDWLSQILGDQASEESGLVRERVAAYRPPSANKGRQLDWTFSPTSTFRSSMRQLDRTLLGRVLVAIAEICEGPTSLRGDTVKPLSGELAGRWRYRIGDYRLIYLPDERRRTVFLLAISPRGNAYAD